MLKNLIIFMLLLPAGLMAQAPADSSVSNHIIHKLQQYSSSHPTEKVYLHFDKPYYAAADTIYYKAYITLGDVHVLSALSRVLHVELIDNTSGKMIQAEKLPVLNGVAWGDFALSDSLAHNDYRVRAYTQLMRNNTDESFFEQNIPVVAMIKSKTAVKNTTSLIPSSNTTQKPDIQFFPEGGSLVNGLTSKIAFKTIASNGLSIGASGQVVDNENKIVCTFKSTHLGMGYFYIIPKSGKTYKAEIIFANGMQDVVDLPKADEDGISLSVNNNDSTIIAPVTISAGKTYFAGNKGKEHVLSIYSGGQLSNISCRLDSDVVIVDIFKRKLHSGITRFTLFSPTGEPLCERLLFVQNNDKLKLSLVADKAIYATREKVSIKLHAADNKNKPVSGDFSVSVTNESMVPVDTNSESTILNNLLLTSDLKGNVEQPNYYFSNAPGTYNDLDLLMLTQGYRGFVWRRVLRDTTAIAKYQPETSLSIIGTVKTPGGKLAPNDDINLVSTNPYMISDTLSDSQGNFTFNGINIIDTARLVLRAKGNRIISIQEPDHPMIARIEGADSTNSQITPALAAEMTKRFQLEGGNMKKGILLKQVNIHETRKVHPWSAPKLLHSDNLNGSGQADRVILGDDMVGYPFLADLFYNFHGPGNRPPVVIIGGVEIPFNDISKPLETIPISDIYSIEVLKSAGYLSVYGSRASGGALVLTMRNGSERSSVHMQPGLTTYKFQGFYRAREFYSPKYEVKTPANSVPDYRSTIYWNPLVLADKDGNASFEFYNADATGTYRVVVEGIDGNGDLGRQVYHYTVR